jgi:integrase
MANVFTRKGKKGERVYYDFVRNGQRIRQKSDIILSGSAAHKKEQLREALIECMRLEKEGVMPSRRINTIVEWINDCKGGYTPKSKENVEVCKRKFIAWLKANNLQHITFDAFTREMAEDYLRFLVRSMRKNSAKGMYGWIKVFYNTAVEEDLIQRNPLQLSRRKIKEIYSEADDEPNTQAFTIEQLKYLVSMTEVPNNAKIRSGSVVRLSDLVLITFLCNGRRINEILGLKWSDIDWESRIITFKTSKTGQVCYVYMCKMLEERLLAIKNNHSAYRGTKVANRSALHVFKQCADTVYQNQLREVLNALQWVPDSGFQGLSHHSIRRSVETLLINKFGFEVGDHLVGHKSASIGMRHYYDKSSNNVIYKEAAEYLESLLT